MTVKHSPLIWTRPLHNWKMDQEKLSLAKFTNTIHLPCFQQAELATVLPKTLTNDSHYSIALTSPLSVKILFRKQQYESLLSKATFYAFGQQTTQTLKSFGAKVHYPSTIHSSEAFAAYLNKTLTKAHKVLLPGGTKRAFDLEHYLIQKGFRAQNIHCYQTTYQTTDASGKALSLSQRLELANKRSVIAFTSPLSTVAFAKAFEPHSELLRKHVTAVAIGQTTYHSCQQFFTRITMASKPTIDHLIQVCQTLF